jgi:membrane protease YdiL (CAAX protease family)
MKKFVRIGAFPSVVDVVVMLLLFFVPQIVISLILYKLGISAPHTSAIDANGAENIIPFLKEQEELGRFNTWVYLSMMLSSIAAILVYIRVRSGKWRIGIKHSSAGFNPNVILVGVLWLLSAQIILEPLVLSLPQSESAGVGLGTWAIITAVISAPILEEVLCRGILFETLRKGWGLGISILVPSLFFGMIHGDIATVIVATVSGLIFGVLYLRTSSIFTTIIVHSINNAMAFTLINFDMDKVPFKSIVGGGTNYYICYGVAVIIFIAASVEAYFKITRAKKEPTEQIEQIEQKEIEEVE